MQELGPNQEKWLKTLESGIYVQGQSYLNDVNTNRYCCLGVACEIFKGELNIHCHIVEEVDEKAMAYDKITHAAPTKVVNHLQLYTPYGGTTNKYKTKLTNLNDIYKNSFKEIAAIIRENPADYFRKPA